LQGLLGVKIPAQLRRRDYESIGGSRHYPRRIDTGIPGPGKVAGGRGPYRYRHYCPGSQVVTGMNKKSAPAGDVTITSAVISQAEVLPKVLSGEGTEGFIS
jgi:hypothetical protein